MAWFVQTSGGSYEGRVLSSTASEEALNLPGADRPCILPHSFAFGTNLLQERNVRRIEPPSRQHKTWKSADFMEMSVPRAAGFSVRLPRRAYSEQSGDAE